MNKTIKQKIQALLPEISQALEVPGQEVVVGGVTISRLEAEKIHRIFQKQLESTSNVCEIEWDLIPLKLCVANRNWRSLQESLNQI